MKSFVFALSSALVFAFAGAPVVHAASDDSASSLRWHACEDDAPKNLECATLTVPLDWRSPQGGETFELPVRRIKASGSPRERIGVLAYNTGGPGSPSALFVSEIHRTLPDQLARRFDLVSWSPRGTIGTLPALQECAFPEIEVPALGPVDWPSLANAYVDVKSAALEDCFNANAQIAPYLGTWFSAQDIDALRGHLGERQINFWGMSYGTTMGRIYAQEFPSRVRTLLLDGAIDPMATTGSYAREQMWVHAMSVARMVQWFTPAVRAAHRRVMAAFEEQPLTTSWQAPITRYNMALGLSEMSARQTTYEKARRTVLIARDAFFAATEDQRQKATDRLADLLEIPRPGTHPESMMDEFVLSFVNCADFPERIDRAEIATVTEQAAKISGIASASQALNEAAMCVGLPNYGVPIEQRAAIRIPNPPIVVNSVADPYTGLLGATLMANAFADSRLITYDSSFHVIFDRVESACVNDPIIKYFVTRQRPKQDIACSMTPPFGR